MSQSIKQRIQGLSNNSDAKELKFLLDAILADLTALRTTVAAVRTDTVALDTGIDTLVAKLNADVGVTDTDYAGAAAMTASAPSALTTTS